VRIDCQQPTEVVDDLQKQLDALYEMRLGWGAEERCSEQYRKAREWLEKDRVKLRGQAKNLIAECNFAFSGSLK
jgi:hypothetical protein